MQLDNTKLGGLDHRRHGKRLRRGYRLLRCGAESGRTAHGHRAGGRQEHLGCPGLCAGPTGAARTRAHAHANTEPDSHADARADSDADADAYSDACANSDADACSDACSDANAHSDPGADAYSHADAYSDTAAARELRQQRQRQV